MPKIKRNDPAPLVQTGKPVLYDQDLDPAPVRAARTPKPKRSGVEYTVALAFFALVFVASAGALLSRLWQDKQTESEFTQLESLIAEPSTETVSVETTADNATRFAPLVARNPDFVGWIKIEGTNLSFPVMYSPDRPDFYLRHDFSQEYSNYGTPYLDEDCTLTADAQSNNLVIYGHNMKTGTIFGCLTDYKEASMYEEHPTIRLDTLYGGGDYEVYAAFAIDVVQDTSFPYNTFLDMDEATFNEFVAETKRRSDVDSGITPSYGDQLLTLSTCEYSSANGRYVVCARLAQDAGGAG